MKAQPLSKTSKSAVTVTVKFDAPDFTYTFDDPWVTLESDAGNGYSMIYLDEVSPGVLQGTDMLDATTDAAGTWWVASLHVWTDFSGYDYDYTSLEWLTTFVVQAPTSLTLNAAPEPVYRGRTLTVKGKLSRLNTGTYSPSYVGYSSQRVAIYFDQSGPVAPRYMGYATTSSTGAYAKTFRAGTTGSWYAVYKGNWKFVGKTSVKDAVIVK